MASAVANFGRKLWSGVKKGFTVVGGVVVVGGTVAVISKSRKKEHLPEQFVLQIPLDQLLVDRKPEGWAARFSGLGSAIRVQDVVDGLHYAQKDERCVGVVARVSPLYSGHKGLMLSKIQEISSAVDKFKTSGKFTAAHAISLVGTGGSIDTCSYLLASAFQHVYLQKSGAIGVSGIVAQPAFFRKLLDKIGVEPVVGKRHEFKSALDFAIHESSTPEYRDELNRLLDNIFGQIVSGIAKNRQLTPEQVRGLVDRGYFCGADAVNAKLIDGIMYYDEVLSKHAPAGVKTITLASYLKNRRSSDCSMRERFDDQRKKKSYIGVVVADGVIVDTAQSGPQQADRIVADRLAHVLKKARKDKKCKAIVLRVNSPGGSYTASDTILRELDRIRAEEKKPIVVSFGDVAASGGYFIALAADRIFAEPGTITGSIGVIFGKFVFNELLKNLGIQTETMKRGENSDLFSPVSIFTDGQWETFNKILDYAYADFTDRVAQSRGFKDAAAVDRVARGRVFTGAEAIENGLVDQIGGLNDAVAHARSMVSDGGKLKVRDLQRSSPMKMIRRELKGMDGGSASAVWSTFGFANAVARVFSRSGDDQSDAEHGNSLLRPAQVKAIERIASHAHHLTAPAVAVANEEALLLPEPFRSL